VHDTLQSRDDKYWTYRASVNYKIDAEKMVYASVAKGEIDGFFNGTYDAIARLPIPVNLQNYKPSTNTTYEIGTKASWLDRRLTTNLAVFYIDYKDLQIQELPPPPLYSTLTGNAHRPLRRVSSSRSMAASRTTSPRVSGTPIRTRGMGKARSTLSDSTYCGASQPADLYHERFGQHADTGVRADGEPLCSVRWQAYPGVDLVHAPRRPLPVEAVPALPRSSVVPGLRDCERSPRLYQIRQAGCGVVGEESL